MYLLEKLSVTDFIDKTVSDVESVKPPPVKSTSFKLVQDVKDLKELAAKLRDANEFVVDLEHNHYRSFQGLTCLVQISTRTEDFIVDTLKLRVQIGPYLREVFNDPTKRKVMHEADQDIIWLQRDFGIYVCKMFDTGQVMHEADQAAFIINSSYFIISHSEDESTGYILSNKVLIEIAKQMSLTTGKLRHLLKSRHPYIERNLGSIVGIVKHSMQNGVAFEPVAKKIVEDDYLTRMKIVKEIHEHN
ncbi:putative 3'-5' exonuclease domain, HRDC-like superfamily, ribonuclease H-like superfamily [Helianthus annuus]|nr:putative 3'-5' exonuclease domain, HRDC-like superfamily, ribonuclease H-like superfamily [Helianthus annuus]KAJ0878697.1 putative 3'-5' exonuclease domain, HRDC-like superfamily, ribonuclease H-like superfamily [Helianthus annuus]KAJ0882923.1 putative ribonuclease D, HRDC-like superfamily, ribonuclease H-like superfamily [Helianthus annuus]